MKPLALAWIALVAATSGFAPDAHAGGSDALHARHRAFVSTRVAESMAPPFVIEAGGGDGHAKGSVYTAVPHGFENLAAALGRPASWCEITPLHLNVKSCTWGEFDEGAQITLYSGRKTYERPDDAHVSPYRFELVERRDDFLRVRLTADEGPLDTRDYVIEIEAIPVGQGESFVHLSYAYSYGFQTRMALASYFATLGADKVGFSVVGSDPHGNAVYVDGIAGMIERNAVRYQLAIQAYLDTLELPEPDRFERRLERWYALTQQHRRQLHEIEEREYLANKRREHSDQLRLQQTRHTATWAH